MKERVICVSLQKLDSSEDTIRKVVRFKEGVSYEGFLMEIRNRFDLVFDRHSLTVKFAPKWSGDMDMGISDKYELEAFWNSLDSGMCNPAIFVKLSEPEDVCELVESAAVVGSNNLKVAAAVNVVVRNELDDEIAVRDELGDEFVPRNELDRICCVNVEAEDQGNAVNEGTEDFAEDEGIEGNDLTEGNGAREVVVVASELCTEEEGLLHLETFREQILALDKCHELEGHTEEATVDTESTQPKPITFSDGSDWHVGKTFGCKKEAYNAISIVAMKGNFEFKTSKSDKERLVLKCNVDGCSWFVRLWRVCNSDKFEVRTYNCMHSCALESASKVHRNASYEIIAHHCQSRFETGKGPSPREIQSTMESELGCVVSYWRAWMGRNAALVKKRGNYELGYAILPRYFEILKSKNPGTVTALELDGEHFLYCFVFYGAALHGFQWLRKVVAVDGTHLTGKYRGVLLCASAQDGNGQIYPMAVAVVDSENDNSWSWFMQRLKECIPDNEELCFISDRHGSIKKAIADVYPLSHHGCCSFHLWMNCKARFKCYNLRRTYESAAKAYTVAEFNSIMETIKVKKPKMYDYLTEDVAVEHWSRSHFPGNRYNIMTTNIAESLNSVLKSEKSYPIYALLVGIQKKLSKWFCTRRTVAGNHSKTITPNVEVEVLPRYHRSRCMPVDRLNDCEFSVRGIGFEYLVNLSRGHCSCRVYDIDRLPCEHAIAALRAVEGDCIVGEGDQMGDQIRNLCHKYYSTEYWRNAYEMTVYPTPHISEWLKPDEAPSITVKPPKAKIPRGRKREKRIPSTGEFPRPPKAKRAKKKCSRCHTEGHTIKKCPEPADEVQV